MEEAKTKIKNLRRTTVHRYGSAPVRLEVADVLLYLIRLADKLDIDVIAAAKEKLAINAEKYPAERTRGTSKKYTDL
jgi:NTP pyrophosphatase (non-canonical NTP hydrolase)